MKQGDVFSDLEKQSRVSEVVLALIKGAGIISIAVLAPNALQMLRLFKKKQRNKKSLVRIPYDVNATITRLEKEGCLSYKKTSEGIFVEMTEKGLRRLKKSHTRQSFAHDNLKWDGKWRVVVFDVEEKKRFARDKLRRELQLFGFKRLQNSVWVFPYDCEDLVTLLKTDQKLWKNVLYMVVDKVENDEYLQKLFRLSKGR